MTTITIIYKKNNVHVYEKQQYTRGWGHLCALLPTHNSNPPSTPATDPPSHTHTHTHAHITTTTKNTHHNHPPHTHHPAVSKMHTVSNTWPETHQPPPIHVCPHPPHTHYTHAHSRGTHARARARAHTHTHTLTLPHAHPRAQTHTQTVYETGRSSQVQAIRKLGERDAILFSSKSLEGG